MFIINTPNLTNIIWSDEPWKLEFKFEFKFKFGNNAENKIKKEERGGMVHGPNILNPAQFSLTPCSPTRGIAAPTPWARLSVPRACEVVAGAWTWGRESPIRSSPSLPGGPFWPGSPISPRPRGPSPSPVMAGFPQLPRPGRCAAGRPARNHGP
jgi:hypothetical protein